MTERRLNDLMISCSQRTSWQTWFGRSWKLCF